MDITYTVTVTHPQGCEYMMDYIVTATAPTPTAMLQATEEMCSEDSPLVAGNETVIDLTSLITSGFTGGTWSTNDAAAAAQLVGSTFTANTTFEGQTITFIYTIDAGIPGSRHDLR